MDERTHREVDLPIEELRARLNKIYAYLDQTGQALGQVESASDHLRRLSKELDDDLLRIRERVQSTLGPIDDAATVMQRQLSHIEDWSRNGYSTLEDSVESVSSILLLGVRLAGVVFSPEQLGRLDRESEAVALDTLRQYWREWLKELSTYLSRILPLARSLARFQDSGLLGEAYRLSFQELALQCADLAATGYMPENALGTVTSGPREMRYFSGPLGGSVVFEKKGHA